MARTRFALSLSEAEDAHTLTVVKAEGSTLSGWLDRRVDLGFQLPWFDLVTVLSAL